MEFAAEAEGEAKEVPFTDSRKQRREPPRAKHGFDGVGALCRAHRAALSREASAWTAPVSEPGARVSATSRDPFKHLERQTHDSSSGRNVAQNQNWAGGQKSSWRSRYQLEALPTQAKTSPPSTHYQPITHLAATTTCPTSIHHYEPDRHLHPNIPPTANVHHLSPVHRNTQKSLKVFRRVRCQPSRRSGREARWPP